MQNSHCVHIEMSIVGLVELCSKSVLYFRSVELFGELIGIHGK